MTRRLEYLLIMALFVLILVRPDFIRQWLARREIIVVINLVVSGVLGYNLYSLIKKRDSTKQFWLKAFFNTALFVIPLLFVFNLIPFSNQSLILFLVVLGVFYTTVIRND